MKLMRVLLILTAVLLVATAIATSLAAHYRNLYLYNPRVQSVDRLAHYTQFDPNRSAAYSCTTQNMSAAGVGMICTSPDNNIQISCTTTTLTPKEYWC